MMATSPKHTLVLLSGAFLLGFAALACAPEPPDEDEATADRRGDGPSAPEFIEPTAEPSKLPSGMGDRISAVCANGGPQCIGTTAEECRSDLTFILGNLQNDVQECGGEAYRTFQDSLLASYQCWAQNPCFRGTDNDPANPCAAEFVDFNQKIDALPPSVPGVLSGTP